VGLQEARGQLLMGQERLDFEAKGFIASARAFEVSISLLGLSLAGGIVQRFDLTPSVSHITLLSGRLAPFAGVCATGDG
jgi:hypothetical protein